MVSFALLFGDMMSDIMRDDIFINLLTFCKAVEVWRAVECLKDFFIL